MLILLQFQITAPDRVGVPSVTSNITKDVGKKNQTNNTFK